MKSQRIFSFFIVGLKALIQIHLFIFILNGLSCSKDESQPTQSPLPIERIMVIRGYGVLLDSSYYKIWSDSSWEKFNRLTTISGITYTTTITDRGTEYYYTFKGYAGFKLPGESVTLFDHPISPLPDTLVFNKVYKSSTTLFYRGYNFTLEYENTLQDTVSIALQFGIFNPCLRFKTKVNVISGSQGDSEYSVSWSAKGPATIKVTPSSGVTLIMVRGVVNGQTWGMASPKHLPTARKNESSRFLREIVKPLSGILIKK